MDGKNRVVGFAPEQNSFERQSSRYPRFARILPLFILLIFTWLFAACGPSNTAGANDFTEKTAAVQRIASEYQASNNLAAAQAGLANLDVPNPNALLVLVAESAISAGDNTNGDALAKLVLALGLTSSSVQRYAQNRGLLPQQAQLMPQPTAQPVAQIQPTATPLPENPTPVLPADTATPVPDSPTATPEPPTATPVTEPQVRSQSAVNVRGGPGTNYPLVGALNPGESVRISGKNPAGDWWQITLAGGVVGWVYGPLVETSGNTGAVALAEIPAPPAPVATPVPAVPAADTPAPPAPAPSGVDFRLVGQRIWDVQENGGFLAGDSVNCGDKQELHVIVLDAAGNRLDGVTVRGVYRNEYHVTGSKGPGLAQYDVNVDGDDIVVAKDTDGREVSSDLAKGITAKPWLIPHDLLIQGRFCRDTASCDSFVQANGCYGHYSWTVTFQRTY